MAVEGEKKNNLPAISLSKTEDRLTNRPLYDAAMEGFAKPSVLDCTPTAARRLRRLGARPRETAGHDRRVTGRAFGGPEGKRKRRAGELSSRALWRFRKPRKSETRAPACPLGVHVGYDITV